MRNLFLRLTVLLFALLLLLPTAALADDIKVSVNGVLVDFSGDQPPVIDSSSRTLVPLRKVLEKLGSDVDIAWDPDTQMISINKGITGITLIIGNPYMTIVENGVSWSVLMDTTPIILNSRTMIPVRAIAEAVYAQVYWDSSSQTVNINCDYEVVTGYVGNADLAMVRRDGKYGCIDRNRNVVIPIEYDMIDFNRFSVSKEKAPNSTTNFNNLIFSIAEAKKNGQNLFLGFSKAYTDNNGNKHEARLDIYEDAFSVMHNTNYVFLKKNGKWGIVNIPGYAVVDFEYEEKPIMMDALVLIKKNGYYGIVNLNNDVIAEPMYTMIGYQDFAQKGNPIVYYQEGYICALRGTDFGYLDKNGNECYPFSFDKIEPIKNGAANVIYRGRNMRITIDNFGSISFSASSDYDSDYDY